MARANHALNYARLRMRNAVLRNNLKLTLNIINITKKFEGLLTSSVRFSLTHREHT